MKIGKKRTKHIVQKDEVEIGPFQLQLMFGSSWEEDIHLFTHSFFCDCGDENRELVNYKSYISNLNDVILRGWCSSCKTIAIRYIETGERIGIEKVIERIRNYKKN